MRENIKASHEELLQDLSDREQALMYLKTHQEREVELLADKIFHGRLAPTLVAGFITTTFLMVFARIFLSEPSTKNLILMVSCTVAFVLVACALRFISYKLKKRAEEEYHSVEAALIAEIADIRAQLKA